MRASGILLLVVLIAAAVVLLLRGQEAQRTGHAAVRAADTVREAGVEAAPFDRDAARRAIHELAAMARGEGDLPAETLARIAATAAAWAEGAPTPSAELTAAVAIRKAADELRQYRLDGDAIHRRAARRALLEASEALDRGAEPGGAGGGSVRGVRDRLENLQQSERERLQELDEALAR